MRFGPPKPSFINTYSLSFDGVDDRLALSSDFVASGEFTISFWMKPSTIAGNGDKYLIGQWPTNFDNAILIDQLSRIRIAIGGVAFTFSEDFYGSNYIVLNTWQNITITRDSSNGVRCFRNGLDFGYSGTPVTNANILTLNSIGRLYSNTYGFSGEFDEIAFLNTDETSNVSTLATAPTVDLSSLNPTVWLRMGDNGAYKDPQWLIPNNKNKDKVSNYSMEFDGVSDYIDCGDNNETEGITTLSISGWFKPNSGGVGGASGIVAKESRDFYVGWYSVPTNSIRFWVSDDDGATNDNVNSLTLGTNANVLNKWHHFVCTWNAVDKLKIYINGVLSNETNSVNANSALPSSTNILEIGRRVSTYFNGNIDNVSLYNSELSQSDVTNIYNGGTPTTISGAIAYYKMGEESTFSGGVWTVPDAVGSNDGTSTNMTIEDRVGSAPSSSNNSLSFNMDLIDRVEDTP